MPKATREPPPTGGVHQNSEHIIVEPAKPTRQPSTQRWREEGGGLACPGLGLDPRGGSPWPGRPGRPGTVRRQLPDAGAILVFLGFSSATGSVALALPQEQVAFAAWHLSPEDDCQEGASPGIALCVLGVLARGPFAPWRSSPRPVLIEEVTEGLVCHPRAPILTLQVTYRKARTSILRSVCWGLPGEWTRGKETGEGMWMRSERVHVKGLAFVPMGQQAR